MTHTAGSRSAKTRRSSRRSKPDHLLVHPVHLGSLFAKRPLAWGEDEAEYDDLLSRVTVALKPTDVIEAMWVKDITDLTWETQRLRRLKVTLLTRGAQDALEEQLQAIPEADVIDGVKYSLPSLVACYARGLHQAVTHIDGLLAKHGLDADEMTARAFAFHMDAIERIERMIAGIDARRSRGISDLERYREGGGRRSRMIADDVIDVS
ncbi:hypothetical protein [Microvirga arabica]|uniref:hypothetical protein n=1 Tax=Microvirga arabica TaxID=1128671 RepID=UPI001939EADD|nr:hypothetical protein [Microvirga arabica]MBM1171012.1 hypothetical protein [Microvirga arabica]